MVEELVEEDVLRECEVRELVLVLLLVLLVVFVVVLKLTALEVDPEVVTAVTLEEYLMVTLVTLTRR
ncbi:MAG: hypothetical protein JRN56_07230 [Nitrososphaerota archaeon]|jgi:hypothetical protein|nr:hypothetical protein [Nitrososphaerota archaeon]MDG6903663.1 hypothetical protein [Nitrososphaerota archaeon]MDG6924512.1 hypothetical protein [Nitrososphaerota archaeon]MDG6941035.1 hypothetical protein [Nitrososphaerota archaeon]MDG6943287.1 hypothetical protein [Nitrososphaerota archaeon]